MINGTKLNTPIDIFITRLSIIDKLKFGVYVRLTENVGYTVTL